MSEIASIEEIISDAAKGIPYILVDAHDREDEGDLIIPAQFATAQQINFMATHARGLICLAITDERATQLKLAHMPKTNQSGDSTAFTVSIEAREGVTTGISAYDRAQTIAVAMDPATASHDLVSPGHVFPLVADKGGVLVRAGHTEAAVDISRMAGLAPAGVLCAVMNDDGTMARLRELTWFGREHNLKIGSITDLIAYRRKSETLVKRVVEAPFSTRFGEGFRIIVYRNLMDGNEHFALVRGAIQRGTATLVRVHPVDIATDLLGAVGASCSVEESLRLLATHDGPAAAVFVHSANATAMSERIALGCEKYVRNKDQRNFGLGAQILRDLGVGEMVLLNTSTQNFSLIEGFGLHVVGTRGATPDAVRPDPARDFAGHEA